MINCIRLRCVLSLWSVLLALLPLLGGCKKTSPENVSGAVEQQATRQVEVAIAQKGGITSSLSLTGTLEALQEIQLTSKIPGKVEKVLVEKGDAIRRGDVVIELEKEELVLAVAQTEAALETAEAALAKVLAGARHEEIQQAEAAVEQARANAEICKLTLDRMENLLRDDSIARVKYDEAKARCDAALAQLRAAQAQYEMAKAGPTKEDTALARAQVEQAKAAVASAKRQLENATIRSPIDGIVAHRNVEPGEVVSPPMMPGHELITIVDTRSLKTTVNVSENRVTAVRLGQEAVIAVDGFPDETFPAKVSRISPVVDPDSRTFKVEILTANPAARLMPGMFARVQLVLAEKTNVIKVPLEAVIKGTRGEVIFVAANGVAKARSVTLGISDGINVEVCSGVEAGQQVIVRGNLGLEDGDRIVLKAPLENR